MFKRVLVPLDGSRDGARAVEYAAEVAKRFGAEVVLLRVVPPGKLPAMGLSGATAPETVQIMVEQSEEQERQDKAAARRYLAGQRTAVEAAGAAVSAMVEVGDPAAVILTAARQEKADLIVMTTRGRSGVKRAFLGSVADAVVRGTKLPVLVIRR
jgi:nucleotide-binding universal stress UspA family protein